MHYLRGVVKTWKAATLWKITSYVIAGKPGKRHDSQHAERKLLMHTIVLFLDYEGDHNFVVWLLEGSRILITPHVVLHEHLGDIDDAPDPLDVVRSPPQQLQRRLRHRPKPTGGWPEDTSHNIVHSPGG